MSIKKSTIRVLLATGLTVGVISAYASPAQAFQQEWWDSATYRASADFIAADSSLTVYGKAGGGNFTDFRITLVKTSSKQNQGPKGWWKTDGVYHSSSYSVDANNAYYIRWESKQPVNTQGVGASPVQN